jgi:hypothetical protein
MISPVEEDYILTHASVPEHLVELMALVSGGEPFLRGDFLCLAKDRWAILVGYPLAGDFVAAGLQRAVEDVHRTFRPDHLWFIAPEVPPALAAGCRERESDHYYTLELQEFKPAANLRRIVGRAARELTVEREKALTGEHQALVREFLERERPAPRIQKLFLGMAEYTAKAASALVLTARRKAGGISAFFVVDVEARQFSTYVVGCHSKRHYVPGASDLLFSEMAGLAREHGKRYLHLGLGVNEGIRRFKEKWGGVPSLRYEFCELGRGLPRILIPFYSGIWSR